MIDCIDSSNAALYRNEIDQMFQRRYDTFVVRRRWANLAHQNGRERDQFDTPKAVYLLSITDDGVVDGGLRLIRTTEPHLLSEVFAHTVSGPVPRGPAIFEMTRYFTVQDRSRARRHRVVAGELLCGMLEYVQSQGGDWITTLLDTFYVPRMCHNGWEQEFIGPATPYAEGTTVAAKIAVSHANLQASRAAHGVEGPVLRALVAPGMSRAA